MAGGCNSPTDSELEGGVLALFEVSGERFSVFVTNSGTISEILALEAGMS